MRKPNIDFLSRDFDSILAFLDDYGLLGVGVRLVLGPRSGHYNRHLAWVKEEIAN